jgi:hypothetical protein
MNHATTKRMQCREIRDMHFIALFLILLGCFQYTVCTMGKNDIQIIVKNEEDQNPSLIIKTGIKGYEIPGFAESLVLGHLVQNKFKNKAFFTNQSNVHTVEEVLEKDEEAPFSNFLDSAPLDFQLKTLAFLLFSNRQSWQNGEGNNEIYTANDLKEAVFSDRQYASLLMRNTLKANELPDLYECLYLSNKISKRLKGKIHSGRKDKKRILEGIDDITPLSFEGMPAEIQWEVISRVIPAEIHSSDELMRVLKTIQTLALTSKSTRDMVTSKYFFSHINKLFNSIADADIFLNAFPQIKQKNKRQNTTEVDVKDMPEVFTLFKKITVLLKKIKTRDVKSPIVEEYLNHGFNPFITFKEGTWMGPGKVDFVNKNLLNYVNLQQYPTLAMRLLELGVMPEHLGGWFFLRICDILQKNTSHKLAKHLFKMLIEKGIDPNTTFEHQRYCEAPLLFFAIGLFVDLALVELLLQKGADPKKEYASDGSMWGCTMTTPWKEAKKDKNSDLFKLFKKYRKSEKS